jgi:hypothetical protein
MKRLILTLVTAAALTACAPKLVVMPQATTTTTAATTTTTTQVAEVITQYVSDRDLYVRDVYAVTRLPLWLTDSQIVQYGYLICQYFDRGNKPTDLAQLIYKFGVQSNVTQEQMLDLASAAGLAVTYLCPQYSGLI